MYRLIIRKFLSSAVTLLLFFTATACNAAMTSINSEIKPQSNISLSSKTTSITTQNTGILTPASESNTDLSVSTVSSYADAVSSKTPQEVNTLNPLLLDTLITGCQCDTSTRNFQNNGLDIGEMAVDFTLRDVNGREYSLSKLLDKPVVMIFGSFT